MPKNYVEREREREKERERCERYERGLKGACIKKQKKRNILSKKKKEASLT